MMPGCGRSWDVRCVDAPGKNRALLLRKDIGGYWRDTLQSLLQDPSFHSKKEHLIKKWELPEFPLWEFVWLLALEFSEGGLPRERRLLFLELVENLLALSGKEGNNDSAEQEDSARCNWGGMGAEQPSYSWRKGQCDRCTGRQGWGSSLPLRGEKSKCSLNWGIKHLSSPTSNLIKPWNSSLAIWAAGFSLVSLHGYDWHAVKT